MSQSNHKIAYAFTFFNTFFYFSITAGVQYFHHLDQNSHLLSDPAISQAKITHDERTKPLTVALFVNQWGTLDDHSKGHHYI